MCSNSVSWQSKGLNMQRLWLKGFSSFQRNSEPWGSWIFFPSTKQVSLLYLLQILKHKINKGKTPPPTKKIYIKESEGEKARTFSQ